MGGHIWDEVIRRAEAFDVERTDNSFSHMEALRAFGPSEPQYDVGEFEDIGIDMFR